MKKKIIALCLIVALAATAVIGGTLAYFTDTDKAVNTFTVGSVDITLNEQQRGEKAGEKTLVSFENGKALYPIVGSAQGDKETVDGVTGLPTAENYVDKIISVTNNAKDAYVRVYIAIPAALDDVNEAGDNVLHYNFNAESKEYWSAEEIVAEGTVYGNVPYNVYCRTYLTALAKDEKTATPAYIGFYLDNGVDYNGTAYTINGTVIDFDMSNIQIPVYAVGVQAEGFDSADAAIDAAFGADFNPFAA